jgi:nitrate reductase beta subunit
MRGLCVRDAAVQVGLLDWHVDVHHDSIVVPAGSSCCAKKAKTNKRSRGAVVIVQRDEISSPQHVTHMCPTRRECQMNFPTDPRLSAVANTVCRWAIAWGQVILFALTEKGRMRVVGRLTYGNNA